MDAQSVYHLEMRVGVAEESDDKRAFLAKYLKSMKSKGMAEQKNNTKTKISTFFKKKKNGREVRILLQRFLVGKRIVVILLTNVVAHWHCYYYPK